MFSSDHAIWKFAWAADKLDDWLPYAEDLTMAWSTLEKGEVEFHNTFEIVLAAFLLEDDLLPASARVAFAKLMLETIRETSINHLGVECLYVRPNKPGRKKSANGAYIRFHQVKALIQEGKSKSEAYAEVANKLFKSPDTIRREYERITKKSLKRQPSGKNDC